jgi:hypothetical protein
VQILKEKLKFPSGTATAQMIATLHKLDLKKESAGEAQLSLLHPPSTHGGSTIAPESNQERREWQKKMDILLYTFGTSSVYMLLSYFFPILGKLPVFTWLGLPMVTKFQWYITPSLSYVGQVFIP